MCPACLATVGLFVAGGLSAGAGTTLLAAKFLRNRAAPAAATNSTSTKGQDHASHRIEK